MNKKRIIFITREIVPFYYGGIGTQFKALAKILRMNGHKVSFLTQKHETFDEVIYRENYGDIPLFFIDIQEYSASLPFTYRYAIEVAKVFEKIYPKINPDIVVCADFGAEGYFLFLKSQAGEYKDTRFILTINGLSFDTISIYESGMNSLLPSERDKPQNLITCAMEDMCVLLSDEIITPSELYWNELKTRLKVTKKAYFIPNCLDKDLFNPNNCDESYDLNNQIILFIGRLDRHKGADLLLKAYLEIVTNCSDTKPQIIFIGRDCFWKEYNSTFIEYWQGRIPKTYSEGIFFLGQVNHDHIIDYLNRATVCVFPSRWEVFGIVCLEAMSCGCPVLVTRGTGLEEVLGPYLSNCTFDVTKGEVELKQKLATILRDSSHLDQLRGNLRERAQELTNTCESHFLELVEKDFKRELRMDSSQLISFYGKLFQLLSAVNDVECNNAPDKQKTYLQVYFSQNNRYSENNSIIMEYEKSQWVTLNVDLPSGLPKGNLRLDPSNQSGTISIKEISIIDKKNNMEIWISDFSNNFTGCKVLGDDEYFVHQNYLIIQAATNDPQILLDSPAINHPAKMKITFHYVDNSIGKN